MRIHGRNNFFVGPKPFLSNSMFGAKNVDPHGPLKEWKREFKGRLMVLKAVFCLRYPS